MDPIISLLARLRHHDKDERYMAVSDLKDMLLQSEHVSAVEQSEVSAALEACLRDESNDVRAIACSCLSQAFQGFSDQIICKMAANLCEMCLADDNEVGDVYLQTLHAMIPALDETLLATIARRLGPILMDAFQLQNASSASALVLLGDLLRGTGNTTFLASEDEVRRVLTNALRSQNEDESNAAALVLADFAAAASNNTVAAVVQHLMHEMEASRQHSAADQVYIDCLTMLCRRHSVPLLSHMGRLIPLLLRLCRVKTSYDTDDAADDISTIRESCLLALASLLRRQYDVQGHMVDILAVASSLSRLDPNYESQTGMDVDEEEDVADDAGEWSDDEFEGVEEEMDATWKVRLAALAVLKETVHCTGFNASQWAQDMFGLAQERIMDHDAHVQAEAIDILAVLLGSGVSCDFTQNHLPELVSKLDQIQRASPGQVKTAAVALQLILANVEQALHIAAPLMELLLLIMEQDGTFALSDTLQALNALASHMASSAAATAHAYLIMDKRKQLQAALLHHIAASSGNTLSDTLACLRSIVRLLNCATKHTSKRNAVIHKLFRVVLGKVEQHTLGSHLWNDIMSTLVYILSKSETACSIQDWQYVVGYLRQGLDKTDCRVASMQHLTQLCCCPSSHISGQMAQDMLEYSILMLSEEETMISNETAKFVSSLLNQCADSVREELVIRVVRQSSSLLKSCSVSFHASLCLLLQSGMSVCVKRSLSIPNSSALLETVAQSALHITGDVSHHVLCIATLASIRSLKSVLEHLTSLDKDIQNETQARNLGLVYAKLILKQQNETILQFAQALCISLEKGVVEHAMRQLYTAGTIAEQFGMAQVQRLDAAVLAYFKADHKPIQLAAAWAFGQLVIGSPSHLLPQLVKSIQSSCAEKHLYLNAAYSALTTARESLASSPGYAKLADALFEQAVTSSEDTVAILAQCVGHVTLCDTCEYAHQIQSLAESGNKYARHIAITAINLIACSGHHVGSISLPPCFSLISDPDLDVSYAAVCTLDSIASHCPSFLQRHASRIERQEWVRSVYKHLEPRSDMARDIDFGGFKERHDDHLQLRRAAFACLLTLLRNRASDMNMNELLFEIQRGARDADAIKLLTYQIIMEAASQSSTLVVSRLDELPSSLLPGVKDALKASKGKNSHHAIKVLTAFVSLMKKLTALPSASTQTDFWTFHQRVLKTALLQEMWNKA